MRRRRQNPIDSKARCTTEIRVADAAQRGRTSQVKVEVENELVR
jgi:hypothetical protein